MSQITATITADLAIVSHLLDTCESLLAACRELQKAKAPQPTTFTVADHPVERVEQVMLTPEKPSRLQYSEKWKDIDVLVQQAIDEPEEWHSCFLDAEQRTKAGFQKILNRLKYVAREHGIRLSIRKYLDEGDEGHFVHIQNAGAR